MPPLIFFDIIALFWMVGLLLFCLCRSFFCWEDTQGVSNITSLQNVHHHGSEVKSKSAVS